MARTLVWERLQARSPAAQADVIAATLPRKIPG